ncbi:MAG: DMT family transporter [Dongiaceae bacterium]
MTLRAPVLDYLGMILMAVLVGTMIPSLVVLLPLWDPLFLSAARYLVAIPMFVVVLLIVQRGRLLPPGLPYLRLLYLAVFGYGMFSPMFTIGVYLCHPATAAILSSSAPVVSALVGRVGFGIPFDRRLLPSIVLTVLGAIIATYDPSEGGLGLTGGEPLIVIAMVMWSWYSLAAQRWLAGMNQIRITGLTLIPGAAIIMIIYLVAGALGFADLPPAAPRDWTDVLIIVWMAFACLFLGILLWNHGIRQFGIVIPSLYMNLVPVVAIGLSAAVGHPPTYWHLAGGLLVFAGILLSYLRRRPPAVDNALIQRTEEPS